MRSSRTGHPLVFKVGSGRGLQDHGVRFPGAGRLVRSAGSVTACEGPSVRHGDGQPNHTLLLPRCHLLGWRSRLFRLASGHSQPGYCSQPSGTEPSTRSPRSGIASQAVSGAIPAQPFSRLSPGLKAGRGGSMWTAVDSPSGRVDKSGTTSMLHQTSPHSAHELTTFRRAGYSASRRDQPTATRSIWQVEERGRWLLARSKRSTGRSSGLTCQLLEAGPVPLTRSPTAGQIEGQILDLVTLSRVRSCT